MVFLFLDLAATKSVHWSQAVNRLTALLSTAQEQHQDSESQFQHHVATLIHLQQRELQAMASARDQEVAALTKAHAQVWKPQSLHLQTYVVSIYAVYICVAIEMAYLAKKKMQIIMDVGYIYERAIYQQK
jgi:hypothetical protein